MLGISRGIRKVILRVFIRLVDEEAPDGIETIEQSQAIMTALRRARDVDFVHPDSVKVFGAY